MGINFTEVLNEIRTLSFQKMDLEMTFAKWRPFCLGLISLWTKWPPFRRQHVQTHFLEWKYFYFKQNFIQRCFLGSNWQYVGIALHNGLAPFRRQAIIWTNVDPVHRRIYAALVGDELTNHDGVIKWKHFPRYWPFVRGIHRSPVNSPYKGQWRGALMFWIDGWVNNRDLRRYRAHYDVTVMRNLS